MTWIHVFWDLEPGGNAEHIAEHGLDVEEVEHVLMNPEMTVATEARIEAIGEECHPKGGPVARWETRRAGRGG